MVVTLDLGRSLVCPHCDSPMKLTYFGAGAGGELKFICALGCKAKYDAVVSIGKVTEGPICGAKRVQTNG